MSPSPDAIVQDEGLLVAKILESQSRSQVVETILQTDEQVIARITDGIYRQPASALREMISNAYDADASRVIIKTDPPRFDRITIEDDGIGMTPQVLAHLLFHIGGSPKRNFVGAELGVTSAKDPARSPSGRRLIGKIGIGLFSVAQLTHSFQIVTKVKGDNLRTIATVVLRQFSEFSEIKSDGSEALYESGAVRIWREHAADKNAHGTTIVLTAVRPQARDTLRSHEIWSIIEQNERVAEGEERQAIEPPKYHIGRVGKDGTTLKKLAVGTDVCVPWLPGDKPDVAFKKLVNCVWQELLEVNPNPKLERLFDYYLRMIWQLSLSAPLPYVEGHLFDEPCSGWASTYELSNSANGAAKLVQSDGKIRQSLALRDPKEEPGRFDVVVDDLKLSRPLKFRDLPTTHHALKKPLVFAGKCQERFARIPRELSGGPLSFEAYLFWTPKIAPTEHQGSLIRIHGSSGTLFDPTFMRYQISEQTRLRQITCEVFVSEGLDGALNIDRESFNHAHPHSVFITKWLYSALRQLATAQKRAAGQVRKATRAEKAESKITEIQKIAAATWSELADDEGSEPPSIELSETGRKMTGDADSYAFPRVSILGERDASTPKARARNAILEEKLKAIAQILASYQLLDQLSKRKQQQLLRAIYRVLETSEAV